MAGESEGLERQLGSVVAVEDVLSVRILNSDGIVLASKVFKEEPKTGSVWLPFYMPWVKNVAVPIVSGKRNAGTVELVYSGRSVNDYMFRLMTIPTIIEGIVLFLVITGIFLHMHKTVGRPLGTLQDCIDRASAGDLTVDIPDGKDNEIGKISKGLKFLVETLRSNISNINETAKKVAVAAGNLYAEFDDVSGSIKKQSSATEGIANSIKQATDAYRDISESTEKLSEFSSDNVSFLLEVKSTSEEIVSNTSKLFKASEDSYSVVAEMSQTSKVITQNTNEVQASVDETLASVEELRASVKEVERNAKESSALASNVREMAAQDGTLVVADAIEGMENISNTVQSAVEMVERLGARSTDVQKMLSVIREVTEQTNLLSLNAAILAEQAGEYGKGFAVVADEMRALSDRTAGSTKEIARVVNTIQDEIANMVFSINQGMDQVNSGETLVYQVGESMGKILEAAQKSSRMAGTIEQATGEQANSLDLVTQSMSNISTMATKMSNVMSEQQSGLEHMLEKVGEVREIAEITKRSTEEQASGTAMMSKNVELASSKISGINAAAFEQQNVSDTIVHSVDDIASLGSRTLKRVDEMTQSLGLLADEIVALRKKMSSFKVE
jgi:methyl-accepting chemotaxis protein